jgi:hypothetical protein
VSAQGSTLTIQLLSDAPIYAPEVGVYSHRLGDRWLVGGASNSGGAALLRFFAADEIEALSPALRPERPTGCALAGQGRAVPGARSRDDVRAGRSTG